MTATTPSRVLRASKFRQQRIAGLILGTATLLLGIMSLAGWVFQVPSLARPFGPVPVYANAAAGLIACGLGCIGLATSRSRLAFGAGVVALLIGGATFLQFVFGLDLRIDTLLADDFMMRGRLPGRMPAVSALALTLTGSALALLSTARRPDLRFSMVGVLGAGVTALALVDLLVGVTGLLGTLRRGLLLGAALPEMIALLLIGAGLTYLAWERDSAQPELPRWIPVASGLGILMTTVFVWRALVAEQNQLLDTRLLADSRAIHRAVNRDLEQLREVTRLIARQAAVAESPRIWQESARHLPAMAWEVDSLIWRGADGVIRATVPGDSAMRPATAANPAPDSALVAGDSTVVIGPGGNPESFAVSAPVCAATHCDGVLTLVSNTRGFFEQVFHAQELEVDVAVVHAGRVLLARPPDVPIPPAARAQRVGPPQLDWTMRVVPNAVLSASVRTTMPEVLLGLGTMLAVLLTITLRLAQTSFERARESERQRLTRALESSTDGVWEWDVRTGHTERSHTIWQRLGYDAEQVEPGIESWTSRIHPDDRDRYDTALRAHLDGNISSFSLEYRIRAADGEWHWIVDQGRIVQRTAWGQPERMLGLVGDVTERKRADAILAESEQRFRAIFQSAMQFQTLMDLDCNMLEANPAMMELGGLEVSDVRGRLLWDAPWWPRNEERLQRLKGACAEARGGKTVRMTEDIRGTGDRVVAIEYSINPIKDQNGKVVQLLFEGRDVTERKRAEAVLREMNTLTTMGRLAAHVAHEINNPLAGIQNSFLLIKDAIPDTHPHYSYVGAIEREMGRIARVTRQLYETYRQGQEEDKEASIVVEASDAVGLLTQLNRSKQVTITLDTAGVPAVVPIPGAIVRQTLFNLVQNAVDASPAGGTVSVRAWTADHTLRLSIRDDGPGVPQELRERVFEPFFSTKSNLRTGGMGIGLSLVRRSIEALGGRVWITGDDGTGAEFQVEIPLTTLEPVRGAS